MNVENINLNIAAIFKATRKFNRLGQVEFSAILEVSQGTISKIEAGLMHPELGLWFKFLRSFNITDPYCFSYGGVEFQEDIFQVLKNDKSALMPMFSCEDDEIVFSVRTIRPLFDFLMKNHQGAFEEFLKKHKISVDVFYILNHPLTFSFVDLFFQFLHAQKINEKALALIDLNFVSAFGGQADSLTKSNSPELFFDTLNKEKDSLVKYKLNKNLKQYTVSLNKKNQSLFETLTNKKLILNYNLLYPYHFFKSTKQSKITAPSIAELKKGFDWEISFMK